MDIEWQPCIYDCAQYNFKILYPPLKDSVDPDQLASAEAN